MGKFGLSEKGQNNRIGISLQLLSHHHPSRPLLMHFADDVAANPATVWKRTGGSNIIQSHRLSSPNPLKQM